MLALAEPAASKPRPISQPGQPGQPPRPPKRPRSPIDPPARGRHFGPRLSPREHEILLWLIEGYTDKEIAEILGISPRTVTTHVTSIYNKLGVFSRVAATTYAFRNNLI